MQITGHRRGFLGIDDTTAKAKNYQRYRIVITFTSLAFSSVFLAVFQLSGISKDLATWCNGVVGNFYGSLALYILIFNATFFLTGLALDFYGGFIVEHKFALSNQTAGRWLVDEVKKAVLSFTVSLFLIEAIYAAGKFSPVHGWIFASIIWLIFTVGFSMLFPVLVIPLFYKYIPLNNDDLRLRIMTLAKKIDIIIMEISMIDFSKNSRKANAAVVGWGGTRRVVLADNLINEFTPDEVEVVIAHEMAHYKLWHIWKLVFAHTTVTVIFFYILWQGLPTIALLLGVANAFDIALLPAVVFCFATFEFVSAPFLNAYSRYLESQADRLAIDATGKLSAFVSLMKRLSWKNLSDDKPHPVIEFLFYDHPPINKRIKMAERYATKS